MRVDLKARTLPRKNEAGTRPLPRADVRQERTNIFDGELIVYALYDRGVKRCSYTDKAKAEAEADTLNNADGSIGNHNLAALTRMSKNPKTRASSSRT